MIQDSLWKLLAIILCVIMLFIIPTGQSFERQDQMMYNLLSIEVSAFSEQVREVGYMDKSMLNDFYAKVYASGLNCQISLEHLEKTFALDGTVMKAYYDGKYTEDIMDTLNSGQAYEMAVGDFFFVEVTSKEITSSLGLGNIIGISSRGLPVYYKSGGVVRYGNH